MPMRLVKATGFASLRFLRFTILAMGLVALYIVVMSVGFPSIGTLGSRFQSKFFPPLEDVTAQVVRPDGQIEGVTFPAFRINSYVWEGDDLIMNGQMCKVQPYEFIGSWWAYGKLEDVWYEALLRTPWRKPGEKPVTRPTGCQYWENWRLVNARNAPIKMFFGRFRYMPDHEQWMVYQTVGPFDIPPKVPASTEGGELPPDATDPLLLKNTPDELTDQRDGNGLKPNYGDPANRH